MGFRNLFYLKYKSVLKKIRLKIISVLKLDWKQVDYVDTIIMALRSVYLSILGKTIFVNNNEFPLEDDSEKISRLCLNLDARSIKVVHTHLNRVRLHAVVDRERMYSSNDLKLIESIRHSAAQDRKSRIEHINTNTLNAYHGLGFLSSTALKYLHGKDYIDGGAYDGNSAIPISRKYFFKRIFSIEPQPENFAKMQHNINESSCKNIIPIHAALGSRQGDVYMSDSGPSSKRVLAGKKLVPMLTIDSISRKYKSTIGFIKLDVEGSEYETIIGSKEVIKRDLPVLSISIYHNSRDFFEIKPMIEEWCPDKYDFIVRKWNPFTPIWEVLLIGLPKGVGEFTEL